MGVRHAEMVGYGDEAFLRYWHVDPPIYGGWFRVDVQEWSADYQIQHVYGWSEVLLGQPDAGS